MILRHLLLDFDQIVSDHHHIFMSRTVDTDEGGTGVDPRSTLNHIILSYPKVPSGTESVMRTMLRAVAVMFITIYLVYLVYISHDTLS